MTYETQTRVDVPFETFIYFLRKLIVHKAKFSDSFQLNTTRALATALAHGVPENSKKIVVNYKDPDDYNMKLFFLTAMLLRGPHGFGVDFTCDENITYMVEHVWDRVVGKVESKQTSVFF